MCMTLHVRCDAAEALGAIDQLLAIAPAAPDSVDRLIQSAGSLANLFEVTRPGAGAPGEVRLCIVPSDRLRHFLNKRAEA